MSDSVRRARFSLWTCTPSARGLEENHAAVFREPASVVLNPLDPVQRFERYVRVDNKRVPVAVDKAEDVFARHLAIKQQPVNAATACSHAGDSDVPAMLARRFLQDG